MAGILDSKTIQDGNYEHAWALLSERYEDKRRMVVLHIGGLLKTKKISSESHSELRALVDSVISHMKNLKFRTIRRISTLDDKMKEDWESTVARGKLQDYTAMITVLKNRISVLERSETTSQDKFEANDTPDRQMRQAN